MNAEADALCAEYGIPATATDPVSRLSVAQRQLLEVARVMPSVSHDHVCWKRCPRSSRADINVASFDLTFDGQIKLIDPPLEPITHALSAPNRARNEIVKPGQFTGQINDLQSRREASHFASERGSYPSPSRGRIGPVAGAFTPLRLKAPEADCLRKRKSCAKEQPSQRNHWRA
jgi:hypothetical protein